MKRQRQVGSATKPIDMIERLVRGVEKVTPTVTVFDIGTVDGNPLPAFEPGAHIKVAVRDRMGMPDARDYSLFDQGPDGTWQIAVKFDPEGMGGSRYMHESVAAGDILRCTLPANDFPMAEDADDSLLIAGGIGITPIFAMASRLAADDQSFALHYVARGRDDMPFAEQIATLAGDRACLYEDDGDPRRGIPLDDVLADVGAHRHLYVCGPEGLIDDTLARAKAFGWPGENLHAERFAAPPPRADDKQIDVVLKKSGRTLQVPANRTILDVLIEAGVNPLYDCRKGTCGLCAQSVVETDGSIDHRDHFFGHGRAAAGDRMCVCVSRVTGSKLVLDL